MKQSNDLEICPRSLTVISPVSCRVAMYVKCSEDSERMKRKSPFSTTPLSFDAPSPANPREYLHKLYTARNYVPCATFFYPWQYMGSSANFRTDLSETWRRQPISWLQSPKQILTQNGHSRTFKVISFGIIEELLMGYIAQYNKCGLRCEDSENIASERSENRHFRPPHSHLSEPPRIFA